MTVTIKKVTVAGATGLIGRHIVNYLLASKLFEVSILSRKEQHDFPKNVAVKVINFEEISTLEEALRGQDAVVSAMGYYSIHVQKNLVEAAAKAGVKRIIPSEYGNDTQNPKLETVPIYQPKIAIRKQLDRLTATNPSFSYTIIMNASFLGPDWTLDFIIDVKNRTGDVKDGGDVVFCATTYDDIAQAVVGILTHLEETANRPVKISSINTTQNQIIDIARSLGATDGWNLTYSKTEELESRARDRWAKGDHSEEVISMFINRAFIGKGWGGYFPVLDNKLLGIEGIDEKGLTDIIRDAMNRP